MEKESMRVWDRKAAPGKMADDDKDLYGKCECLIHGAPPSNPSHPPWSRVTTSLFYTILDAFSIGRDFRFSRFSELGGVMGLKLRGLQAMLVGIVTRWQLPAEICAYRGEHGRDD